MLEMIAFALAAHVNDFLQNPDADGKTGEQFVGETIEKVRSAFRGHKEAVEQQRATPPPGKPGVDYTPSTFWFHGAMQTRAFVHGFRQGWNGSPVPPANRIRNVIAGWRAAGRVIRDSEKEPR